MRGSSFSYMIKHGIQSLWLNRLMTLASVGILTACLLLTGGSAMLAMGVHSVFQEIEGQNEMHVFIKMDATDAEIAALRAEIDGISYVDTITYVSKSEAFEEQKGFMGEYGALFDGLEADTDFLPASFRLTLTELDKMRQVQTLIEGLPGVDSIIAPVYVAETLTGIEHTLIIVGGIIVGLLMICSMVVIANTIKLTVFARRREINIMKYVGATNSYIRLPFVIEGIAIGVLAALVAFFALWGLYYLVTDMLVTSSVPWVASVSQSLTPFTAVWYWMLGGFAAFGIVVGSISSGSAIRKHLKV